MMLKKYIPIWYSKIILKIQNVEVRSLFGKLETTTTKKSPNYAYTQLCSPNYTQFCLHYGTNSKMGSLKHIHIRKIKFYTTTRPIIMAVKSRLSPQFLTSQQLNYSPGSAVNRCCLHVRLRMAAVGGRRIHHPVILIA